MLLSCIVPIYNRENSLRICLDSLLSVRIDDMEIILVDDGSTDDSYSICEEYERRDSRIKVYRQNNAGVSSARNLGLSVALGDYISFVDSDDEVISETYSAFGQMHHDKDFYLFDYYLNSENHYIKRDLENDRDKSELINFFLFHNNNMIWSNIYKSQIICKYGVSYDDTMKMGEDLVFNINFVEKIMSYEKIDRPLYIYRDNICGSATNRMNVNYIYDYIKMFDVIWPYLNGNINAEKFNWNIYINGIFLNLFSIRGGNQETFEKFEESMLYKKITEIHPEKIKMKFKAWCLKTRLYRNVWAASIIRKIFY